MTTKINNEHNKLNFSSEREQSQACLNSAEHEKNQGRKVLNVPNLRFLEFQGEWKELGLSELLDFKNGLNPKPDKFGKGIKFISVMDILNNAVITYDCIKASVDVTEKELSDFSVEKGDILFQRSSETLEDVGRANVYMDDKTAVFGGFVIRGKKKGEYDPQYFNYLLRSPFARKRIVPMGAGAQHFNIGQEGLSKVKLHFANIKEQKKIGKMFSLLDERIATQNKIIDKLQSLIRGIRHDIFKDIQGEVLALSNIADIYQPQTISSSDLTSEGYWVYGANGIIGKYKEYNHETEQICITCRGNTCGTVNYTQPKVWITGNTMVINTDKYQRQVNKRFLFHYLSSYNFKSIVSGSGQPQIVRTPLEKIKVVLPTIEKQERIANSIDIVSEKINTESSVLRLLENQKLYLLRQMFI